MPKEFYAKGDIMSKDECKSGIE